MKKWLFLTLFLLTPLWAQAEVKFEDLSFDENSGRRWFYLWMWTAPNKTAKP